MKKIHIYLIFLIVLITSYQGHCIKVATPIFPLYDIVNKIVGKHAKVIYIIKPGENPHHFEPTIETVKKIYDADIYFGIDRRFDGWINKILKKRTVIFLNDFIKSDNPHIWLSFKNISKISDIITNKLCDIDKTNCRTYKKNSKILKSKMKYIYNKYNFNKNISVIECHPAWTKFLKEINIISIGYIKKGDEHEPSIKSLTSLIKKANDTQVRFIICSTNDKSKINDTVAHILTAKKIVLEPIGGYQQYDSIYSLFEINLKKIYNKIYGK